MKYKVVISTRRYGQTAIPTLMKKAIAKYLKDNPTAKAIVKKFLSGSSGDQEKS